MSQEDQTFSVIIKPAFAASHPSWIVPNALQGHDDHVVFPQPEILSWAVLAPVQVAQHK